MVYKQVISLWIVVNPPVGCPGGRGPCQFYCTFFIAQSSSGGVPCSPPALCFATQMYLRSYLAFISGIMMIEWENEARHPQSAQTQCPTYGENISELERGREGSQGELCLSEQDRMGLPFLTSRESEGNTCCCFQRKISACDGRVFAG